LFNFEQIGRLDDELSFEMIYKERWIYYWKNLH